MLTKRNKNREVQNLLTVLASAIFCAALLAAVFIYYYNPSGSFIAGRTILDPTIFQQIDYQESDPKTKQKVHFLFDHLEFSYFDTQGQVRKQIISLENYKKFYDLIASEINLQEVTHKIEDLFLVSHPTVLTTNMRTKEASGSSVIKIFQVVQFVKEDYFRIQLRGRLEQGEWVYFYRPNLYRDIMHLFTQK